MSLTVSIPFLQMDKLKLSCDAMLKNMELSIPNMSKPFQQHMAKLPSNTLVIITFCNLRTLRLQKSSIFPSAFPQQQPGCCQWAAGSFNSNYTQGKSGEKWYSIIDSSGSLASEFEGSSCLWLPSSGITNVCSMLDVIYMNYGNPAQVLIFAS